MKIRIILFSLLTLVTHSVYAADIYQKMTEKITSTSPVCANCRLIFQKKDSEWMKKHDLYEITTFDILPPPAWHMVIQDDKNVSLLHRNNLAEWNQIISSESIKLDSDTKILGYVKFFLTMTMNQSEFIDKLLQSEVNRIEAKQKKKVESVAKITKADDKIQILFYAKDTQGDLQQWNMVVKINGEIVKLQEQSF